MSHAPVAEAKIGHNLAPVIAPTEDAITISLKSQYPKVYSDLDDMLEAAKTFPAEITEDDQASALQALIKKMKTSRSSWKAWRGLEKKPWDGVAKIVYNWFIGPEEKIEKVEHELETRLTKWSEAKAEQARQDAARVAEEERKKAEELAAAAAYAAESRLMAEAFTELAEWNEQKARERAVEEERRAAEARVAAEAAAAEQKRIEDEKKARDRAEREDNAEKLKMVRRYMKDAEKLHEAAAEKGDEAPASDIEMLDSMIRHGGTIGLLAGPIAGSTLLDDEQRTEIAGIKTRLDELRKAFSERLDAKENRKRAKARQEAEERERLAADQRRKDREADEERSRMAREERERTEAAALEARGRVTEAKAEVKTHVRAGAEAAAGARDAGREATALGRQAEKQDSRATRTETKAGSMSDADASRHRGDAGTTSSIRGHWKANVIDPRLLPADQLWNLISDDDKAAAVTKWMRLHQAEWGDKDIVKDALPGVVFTWDTTALTV